MTGSMPCPVQQSDSDQPKVQGTIGGMLPDKLPNSRPLCKCMPVTNDLHKQPYTYQMLQVGAHLLLSVVQMLSCDLSHL